MRDKEKDELLYKNAWMRDFNESRTNFWISLLCLLFETIIPGILILILVDRDFNLLNLREKIDQNIVGWVFLICFVYLIYTILITIIFYFCRFHKEDNFTYSISVSFAVIAITVSGEWLGDEKWMLLVRFIIMLIVTMFSLFFGIFLTSFFINKKNKKLEYIESVIHSENNNETIPNKVLFKMQKRKEYIEKQQKIKIELNNFKEKLEDKNTINKKKKEDVIIYKKPKKDN